MIAVIGYNLDVIKAADWFVNIDPEGGTGRGAGVAAAAAEPISVILATHTECSLPPPPSSQTHADRSAAA